MQIFIIIVCTTLLVFPSQVYAYMGPGLGLGVIGVVFGVLFSVLLGILGIFWYPIKRLFRKTSNRA